MYDGGVLPRYVQVGEINVTGGEINVYGGDIGGFLSIYSQGAVNVFGGTVMERLDIFNGGVLNVYGGTINSGTLLPGLDIFDGGVLNVYNGEVGGLLEVNSGAQLSLTGGQTGELLVFSQAQLNIVGSDFRIDGRRSLYPRHRGGSLTGQLSDGAGFEVSLYPSPWSGRGYSSGVHPDATRTLTLVPEPRIMVVVTLGLLLLWAVAWPDAQREGCTAA